MRNFLLGDTLPSLGTALVHVLELFAVPRHGSRLEQNE